MSFLEISSLIRHGGGGVHRSLMHEPNLFWFSIDQMRPYGFEPGLQRQNLPMLQELLLG